MIQNSRIKPLNTAAKGKGNYVLYWMQASQRIEMNHALVYAIREANNLNLPVLVYFELTEKFPEANERHYYFMLEGLKEVRNQLSEMQIGFFVSVKGRDIPDLYQLSESAALVVADCGYLAIQRQWRLDYSQLLKCPLVQVESDVIVPVEVASNKEEYSAATLRRKITPLFKDYLVPLEQTMPNVPFPVSTLPTASYSIDDIPGVLSDLHIDKTVKPSVFFQGGTGSAIKHMTDFLTNKLIYFHQYRNDPSKEFISNLSPYLHFGQISPLKVALEAMKYDTPATDVFLEELIVRRELAINFVYYNPNYMSYSFLPDWAKKTLANHQLDIREYIYSMEELEFARTHDLYWNAAQKEMMLTGKMHGYMRMYWGKKILEWSRTPSEAFHVALTLNNKYELDGRDANGFAGVAWCFGKHDRPWGERPVFGNIRYMNANGLKRKFDINAYVSKIQELESQ